MAANKLSSVWSDDQLTARFVALVKDGVSYGKIAAEIGVSRSAAIGKASRMGIAQTRKKATGDGTCLVRVHQKDSARMRVHVGHQSQFVNAYIESDLAPTVDDTKIKGKRITELGEHDCRFPIGAVGDPDFRFCAEPALECCSYCATHARRCFTQPAPRGPSYPWRP